jgi:hypothetical protein
VCRIDEEKETTWDMCEGMIMTEKEKTCNDELT